jgi:hypothetical protein
MDRPGLAGVAFSAGILLLRRVPAWLVLARSMPWTSSLARTLFAGWFGPIGAAALFYVLEVQRMIGLASVWSVISLAVGASVLVHGATDTPFTWAFRMEVEAFRGADPFSPSSTAPSDVRPPASARGESGCAVPVWARTRAVAHGRKLPVC